VDGLILLQEARQAGLKVSVSGDTLVVQGLRRLQPFAQTLLAEKSRVIRALAEEQREIAWRIDAMRPQVTATGAIPLLLARPGIRFPAGTCCSCGEHLTPDDRYRCPPCVVAATAVLVTVR